MSGPHLGEWEVSSLHGDPRSGRTFAGTCSHVYGTTIRVSDDDAKTWRQIEKGPAYSKESGFALNRIWQIVPGHSSQPGTLYAGVDEAGLFVSRDNGESWNEVSSLSRHPTRPYWMPGNGGLCLHTILVDPNDGRRIWVGISAVGVFRSDDGGESWKMCNNDLPVLFTGSREEEVCRCVHKMVLDPQTPGTLYMQYHGGVFRSTDAGDSWQSIESGLPGNFGFPMCITRRGELFVAPLVGDCHRVFKDGKICLYRSRDGGESWQPQTRGFPPPPQFVGVLRDAMAADQCDPPGVYFGTTMGEVFCSIDAGDSWTQLPGQFPRINCVRLV